MWMICKKMFTGHSSKESIYKPFMIEGKENE